MADSPSSNQFRETLAGSRLLLFVLRPPPSCPVAAAAAADAVAASYRQSPPCKSPPLTTCEAERYGREADIGARHGNTAGDSQRWIALRGRELCPIDNYRVYHFLSYTLVF